MAALTTQQVLEQAGRKGWRPISIGPQFVKNPISDQDWAIQHPGQPYQQYITTGNYEIRVLPPSGSGLAPAGQSIIVEPDKSLGALDLNQYLQQAGPAVETPLWNPNSIIPPTQAPQSQPQGPAAKPAPFSQWTPTTDPNSGRQGWQDPNTGQIVWSPEKEPNRATLVTAPDGSGVYSWDGNPANRPQLLLPGKPAQPTYTGFGDSLYRIDPDGTITAVLSKPEKPEVPTTRQGPDGRSYQWDPAKQTWVPAPGMGGVSQPPVKTDQGTFIWNPDKGTYEPAPGIPQGAPPVTSTSQGAYVWDQASGTFKPAPGVPQPPSPTPQVVNTDQGGYIWNPDTKQYEPAPGLPGKETPPQLLGGQDSTAPYLLALGKDKDGNWAIQQYPNPNGLTVDAALFDFTGQLRGMLGPGDHQVPLSVAKDLATQAVAGYNAQTNRMQATNQGAQVGAGILENRVSNFQQGLQTFSSLANNRNFGLGGGLPPDMASNLIGGLLGTLTELGGGQAVYDAAAKMVQQANPQMATSPMGAQASAVLGQMLERMTPPGVVPGSKAPKPPDTSAGGQTPVTINIGGGGGQSGPAPADMANQQSWQSALTGGTLPPFKFSQSFGPPPDQQPFSPPASATAPGTSNFRLPPFVPPDNTVTA